MTIEEIMRNSNQPLDFTNSQVEIREVSFGKDKARGQVLVDGDIYQLNGIARAVFDNSDIYEGQFKRDKLNGFARSIHVNGAYYQGMQKDNKKHGKGIMVLASGETQEGIFIENKFTGAN